MGKMLLRWNFARKKKGKNCVYGGDETLLHHK